MATKYSVSINVGCGAWMPCALFSEDVPKDAMIDFVDSLWANLDEPEDIRLTDMDTGEVIYNRDSQDDDLDWGFNEDMGYDPYMGCYTDDC